MDQAILHSDITYICEHRNEIAAVPRNELLNNGLEIRACWLAGVLGSLEVVKYFYYLGHNLETCLVNSCYQQHCDIVDWLITRIRLPKDIIFYACQNGDINVFNALISAGANLDIQGWNNPMLTACRRGHNHIVLQLYLLGLDVNQQLRMEGGKVTNALAIACDWNLIETVRLLLDLGAIPVRDKNGQLPHEACKSLEIKELFKDYYNFNVDT